MNLSSLADVLPSIPPSLATPLGSLTAPSDTSTTPLEKPFPCVSAQGSAPIEDGPSSASPEVDKNDGVDSLLIAEASTRLPLEILEHILGFVFLRDIPTNPYSNPFPLHSTSHLLRISKAFRDLALPLFFRSITLSRPSHFAAFFHPETGLFVAGECGRQRWSLVREICVVSGVCPPLVASRPSQAQDEGGWVVPLVFPTSDHRMDLVCVMDVKRTSEEDPLEKQDVHRLVEEGKRSSIRDSSELMILEEFRDYMEETGFQENSEGFQGWAMATYEMSFEDTVDDLVSSTVELWIEADRERVVVEVLRCGNPRVLALPHDPFVHEPLLSASADLPLATSLQLHLEPGSAEPDVEVLVESVSNLRTSVGVDDVELLGYSEPFLTKLTEEYRTVVQKDGEADREVGMVDWRWTRDDGVVVELKSEEVDA